MGLCFEKEWNGEMDNLHVSTCIFFKGKKSCILDRLCARTKNCFSLTTHLAVLNFPFCVWLYLLTLAVNHIGLKTASSLDILGFDTSDPIHNFTNSWWVHVKIKMYFWLKNVVWCLVCKMDIRLIFITSKLTQFIYYDRKFCNCELLQSVSYFSS